MPRHLFLFLTAVAILSAPSSAAAQKFLPQTIQFKGAPEYSDQEMLDAAGLKKGTALTIDEMKGHFQRLMDTGVFDNVSYKFDGVDLVYTVTPAALMYPVRIENLPLASGKEIDDKLHDRFPLYHGKVPPEGGLLESVRAALEEMLAAQGIKATVSVTPFGPIGAKTATALNFSIAAPPVLVGEIRLQGVSSAMQAKINSITGHASGTPFDTANSSIDLVHALETLYADQGFAAVKVHAASGAPVITPAAISIPYSVTIDEGKIYKLGSIQLPADSLVPQADIDKLSSSPTNAPSKGAALRAIWVLICSRYKDYGYLDCAVTPHPQLDDATATVNYTVDIDPGPVYHLALVKFENVSDDLRKLLMRNWQMLPGDPFSESYVANFIATVEKDDPILASTLFGVKINYDVHADPQTHGVNCVIRLGPPH
ncbi:MAG: POTRA domain-containing protein [Terracidiphilus sp.]|jgi:outer membrane protein assembly factor BamA